MLHVQLMLEAKLFLAYRKKSTCGFRVGSIKATRNGSAKAFFKRWLFREFWLCVSCLKGDDGVLLIINRF